MEYVLQTKDLNKKYGSFCALNSLTMNVPKGAIYGLVGRNGAGKTTLIRIICGLQEPTNGTYALYGHKNSERGIEKSRLRMGAVVETPSIYMGMTARDNLKQQYRILGMPNFDKIDEILSIVGLADTGKKLAKHFSLGMRQRLGIAIALAGNPDLLVLDEPTNGLDPQGIIEIRELILRLNREQQITIIISSHILDELSKLATYYGFIDHGTMIEEISADDLEQSCQKSIRVQVSSITVFSKIADQKEMDYKIIADNKADIYSNVNITQLALALADEGCDILSVAEQDESLEGFFINLVGGAHHE